MGADTAVKEPMLAFLLFALQCRPLRVFLLIAPFPPFLFQCGGLYAPFTAALAVGARARVPDRLVGHVDGWLSLGWVRGASSGGDLKLYIALTGVVPWSRAIGRRVRTCRRCRRWSWSSGRGAGCQSHSQRPFLGVWWNFVLSQAGVAELWWVGEHASACLGKVFVYSFLAAHAIDDCDLMYSRRTDTSSQR